MTQVSANSLSSLRWGAVTHRDGLRCHLGGLLQRLANDACAMGHKDYTLEEHRLASARVEWEALPYVVPQTPPRQGYVYVTHEACTRILVRHTWRRTYAGFTSRTHTRQPERQRAWA